MFPLRGIVAHASCTLCRFALSLPGPAPRLSQRSRSAARPSSRFRSVDNDGGGRRRSRVITGGAVHFPSLVICCGCPPHPPNTAREPKLVNGNLTNWPDHEERHTGPA